VDIESMRTFLSVARNRSISRAAQELYATQPTVSVRIKRIEQNLGFSVFLRSWKGVELTPEGRHILPTIADYLFRLQTAKQMAQQDVAHSGVSSIMDAHATLDTVAIDEWLLGEGTTKLVATLDSIKDTQLRITSSAQLRSMVAHGVCTLGVAYSDGLPKAWSNRETLLWSEPLALVHRSSEPGIEEQSVEAITKFFSTRAFLLMDDPVFTDHSGVTGPMLEDIAPATTRVVDHVDVMASLCMEPGNATMIPAGLCRRRAAFNQPGITWTVLDCPWGPVPVTSVENSFDQTETNPEVRDAISFWAITEQAQGIA